MPSGVFDSGILYLDDTYSFTFAQPATYAYFCIVHPDSMQGTVVVTALGNEPPLAVDDDYATDEDTLLSVAAVDGVLSNDSDGDGDPLTANLVTDVSNGTLNLDDDGSVTYDPTPGFNGTDQFTYAANDGIADSNEATATIIVGNQAPEAVSDIYTVNYTSTLNVPAAQGVLANDSDPNGDALTAVLIADVTLGTLSLSGDGSFRYDPPANATGTDMFTYVAHAGELISNLAAVVINVVEPVEPQTMTIRWGPITVPGAPDGEDRFDLEPIFVGNPSPPPCTDCFVTGFEANVAYADGTRVNFENGGQMHHTGYVNDARADPACPDIRGFGESFFLAGSERTPVVLPDGYGYYNPPRATGWLASGHLVNFTHDPKEMYIELTITYVPGSQKLKPVTPISISVPGGCGFQDITVPEGYSDTHSAEWEADRGGDIVHIMGHVHDFGVSISAEHVETGEYLCNATAEYAVGSTWSPYGPGSGADVGHPASHIENDPGQTDYLGHIENVTSEPFCSEIHHVKKGDRLRLHAQYYAPYEDPTVMGIMRTFMHVTGPPDCILTATAEYIAIADAIHVFFSLGTPEPALWRVMLIARGNIYPFIQQLVPVTDPAQLVVRVLPVIPGSAAVGLLTTLTNASGETTCLALEPVWTGLR